MNERDEFIRAICEQPADDTLRLVFADWLEEHGDSDRATFIRCGIELEGFRNKHGIFCCEGKGTPFDCSGYARFRKRCRCVVCSLRRREYECSKVAGAYAGGFEWAHLISANNWRRGFIHTVRCRLADWLEHGSAIVAVQPVERVELTGMGNEQYRAVGTLLPSECNNRLNWARQQAGLPLIEHAPTWQFSPPPCAACAEKDLETQRVALSP